MEKKRGNPADLGEEEAVEPTHGGWSEGYANAKVGGMSPSPGEMESGRSKRKRRERCFYSPSREVEESTTAHKPSRRTSAPARTARPSPATPSTSKNRTTFKRPRRSLPSSSSGPAKEDPVPLISEILLHVKRNATNEKTLKEQRVAEIEKSLPSSHKRTLEYEDLLMDDEDAEQVARERDVLIRAAEIEDSRAAAEGIKLDRRWKPTRNRTHWDYVLAEMALVSVEYREANKWKMQSARRVSKAVMRYFLDAESRESRSKKELELQLRRRANQAAREVRRFWKQIKQVADFIHEQEREAEKKVERERQLNDLLGQTEKYTSMIADDLLHPKAVDLRKMNETCRVSNSSDDEAAQTARRPARNDLDVVPQVASEDSKFDLESADLSDEADADFAAPTEEVKDDEATIDAEEAKHGDMGRADEIDDLQGEAEIDIREVLRAQGIDVDAYMDDQNTYLNGTEDDKAVPPTGVEEDPPSLSVKQELAAVDREGSTDAEEDGAESRIPPDTGATLEIKKLTLEDVKNEMSALSEKESQRLEALLAEQGLKPEDCVRTEASSGDEQGSSAEEDTFEKMDEGDYDESCAMAEDQGDDEETIEMAEKEFTMEEAHAETNALQEEMDIPIEEVLRMSGIDPSEFNLNAVEPISTNNGTDSEVGRSRRRRRRASYIVEEGAKTKSTGEEAKTKSAEEEAKTKSAEEEAKTKSAEEEAMTKSEEEARTRSAEEEAKTRSAEEEAKTKLAEEEAKTKLAEEEAETRSAKEEAQTKLAEEGAEKRSDEEEAAETRSAEEEAETKLAEEEAETKAAEEVAATRAAEEEAATKAAEEEAETKLAEENTVDRITSEQPVKEKTEPKGVHAAPGEPGSGHASQWSPAAEHTDALKAAECHEHKAPDELEPGDGDTTADKPNCIQSTRDERNSTVKTLTDVPKEREASHDGSHLIVAWEPNDLTRRKVSFPNEPPTNFTSLIADEEAERASLPLLSAKFAPFDGGVNNSRWKSSALASGTKKKGSRKKQAVRAHRPEGYDAEELQGPENHQSTVDLIDEQEALQNRGSGDFALHLPTLLHGELRIYQIDGVQWLVSLYERNLNGILADEMGLGKTIMTIALIGWLAERRGVWGPHLIIVPTSVMLNWEVEFKKWCPGLKILTYFGSQKERKRKRQGWTKYNSFHVCITSYKLVVQDAVSFRRKKWKYMILDEAQHIKNFQSQRWQTLLQFSTKRRLLLSGTPLQNSVMELWSLMHFLMPEVFSSHTEFKDWFLNPINTVLGEEKVQENALVVKRLHTVLRPFLLRRLKSEVEKKLPSKTVHILRCLLSKRQRLLYEDFMARGDTKATLESGSYLGVMNVLMQLRKVCNHPDLFEGRPIVSPLHMPGLEYAVPRLVVDAVKTEVFRGEDKSLLDLELLDMEQAGHGGSWLTDRLLSLCAAKQLVAKHESIGNGFLFFPGMEKQELAAAARLARYRRGVVLREAMLTLRRCAMKPIYGSDLMATVSISNLLNPPSLQDFGERARPITERFCTCITAATAPEIVLTYHGMRWRGSAEDDPYFRELKTLTSPVIDAFSSAFVRQKVALPDSRLIQWDCGKLQVLAELLQKLKQGKHRCLIFTQMTKVLDILETFLNLHHHRYLRLDGSTNTEERQKLMERFNTDDRIFCFILTTRAGGVGLNLTGADCVLFYDSDWNPQIDAQAQDRAHRIGQTRPVHIYRLISERTVEENILATADQKRALESVVIGQAGFNRDGFQKLDVMKLILPAGKNEDAGTSGAENEAASSPKDAKEDEDLRAVLEADEDRVAQNEKQLELEDFGEEGADQQQLQAKANGPTLTEIRHSLNPIQRYALRWMETVRAYVVAPAPKHGAGGSGGECEGDEEGEGEGAGEEAANPPVDNEQEQDLQLSA